MAWIEGDDTHLSNGPQSETVADFIVNQGLKNYCCVGLSIDDALVLAKVFSPARVITGTGMDGKASTTTIEECVIVDGLIVQNITHSK